MSNTINLTEDDVELIFETGESIGKGSWRHGHTETYIFQRDGKTYETTLRFHPYEGLQDKDCSVAYEVTPVKVEVTKYVRVKSDSAPVSVPAAAK